MKPWWMRAVAAIGAGLLIAVAAAGLVIFCWGAFCALEYSKTSGKAGEASRR